MSVIYNGSDTANYQHCQQHPDDPYCYCNAIPAACIGAMAQYANSDPNSNYDYANWLSGHCTAANMTSPECRSYANSYTSYGVIDKPMTDFCKTEIGQTDDLCSCINSKLGYCANKFDKNCKNKNGYQTFDMITATCPDMLTCDQQVTLDKGALSLLTHITQNCSTSSEQTILDRLTSPLSTEITKPAVLNNAFFTIMFDLPVYIYLVVMMLILLILIAVGMAA